MSAARACARTDRPADLRLRLFDVELAAGNLAAAAQRTAAAGTRMQRTMRADLDGPLEATQRQVRLQHARDLRLASARRRQDCDRDRGITRPSLAAGRADRQAHPAQPGPRPRVRNAQQDAAAVNLLLAAERLSPQLVRYDGRTREVITSLLHREHPVRGPRNTTVHSATR